ILLFLAAAMLWLAGRYARWASTSFVLTNSRVVYRTGVLTRHGREIPLERLNDIAVHQSILERLVGTGRLYIESAGATGQEAFIGVPDCLAVQKAIHHELARSRRWWAEQTGGRPLLTVPEQLEKLDELCQRGVITRAEVDGEAAVARRHRRARRRQVACGHGLRGLLHPGVLGDDMAGSTSQDRVPDGLDVDESQLPQRPDGGGCGLALGPPGGVGRAGQ